MSLVARAGFRPPESLPLDPGSARVLCALGAENLHRASLRELSRCRHAALDRILLLPTETYVGDPEQCRRMDDSPDDPGISNAWDSSDSYGASGGGPSRGA